MSVIIKRCAYCDATIGRSDPADAWSLWPSDEPGRYACLGEPEDGHQPVCEDCAGRGGTYGRMCTTCEGRGTL